LGKYPELSILIKEGKKEVREKCKLLKFVKKSLPSLIVIS